uniref:Deoxyribonuclease-2-alpha n=1 Tax=Anabas testudineus TaxID=64144 RepID=A0A7N6ASI5_ANATE
MFILFSFFPCASHVEPKCGFIAYNDQPPPGHPSAKAGCGHSKGLVMVDEDTVVWVLHSTPKFPKTRESNSFFPSSGVKNAQTFICVTFHKSELETIGNVPGDMLTCTVNQFILVELNVKYVSCMFSETHLRNIRAHIFDFANTKFFSADIENFLGDLYVTIANTLKTNLYAQTCGGQDGRSAHSVYNIEQIQFLLVEFKQGSDHSKWCVSEDKDWTCIGDSNRALSQFDRPGGALCIKNEGVRKAFFDLKFEEEKCSGTSEKQFRTQD